MSITLIVRFYIRVGLETHKHVATPGKGRRCMRGISIHAAHPPIPAWQNGSREIKRLLRVLLVHLVGAAEFWLVEVPDDGPGQGVAAVSLGSYVMKP
jgi:hypothetical protein